jgi:hypothetical protein
MTPHPLLRVARPTLRLDEIAAQYRAAFGFEELGRFVMDDAPIRGVMLGHPEHAYHLEFTQHAGATPPPSPSPDQLLVFYVPEARARADAMERCLAAGLRVVPSSNPYWDEVGSTYEDLEGHRVVICSRDWRALEARNREARD